MWLMDIETGTKTGPFHFFTVAGLCLLLGLCWAAEQPYRWHLVKQLPSRTWNALQVDAAPLRETRPPKLTSIFFLGARGWAVGEGGALARTLDSGVHWTTKSLDTKLQLFAVSFVNLSTGWMVGTIQHPTKLVILHSSDGGEHWESAKKTPQFNNSSIKALCVLDPNHGWAVGRAEIDGRGVGIILRMSTPTDWYMQYEEKAADGFLAISFVNSDQGWVLGTDRILHTEDGGAHWAEQYHADEKTDAFFTAVDFISNSEGWVVGGMYSGHAMHTTDGGRTWANLTLPTITPSRTDDGLFAYSVKFLDSRHGLIGSSNGRVLYTQNGGETWAIQNTGQHSAIRAFAATPGAVFAVTSGGTILDMASGFHP
jgi:photosystem II stability/assembly factor-like uncharacterized protein